MNIDKEKISKAIHLYLKEADLKESNAGYSGMPNDGGASKMRDQVSAYVDGLNGIVPNFLKQSMEKLDIIEDPEYATYQELKKKFG